MSAGCLHDRLVLAAPVDHRIMISIFEAPLIDRAT